MNYRVRNCELEAEIAANEREIIKLGWKLTELHNRIRTEEEHAA